MVSFSQKEIENAYFFLAEVHLAFDLYTEAEAKKLLQALGEKTFTHFSDKMKDEDSCLSFKRAGGKTTPFFK